MPVYQKVWQGIQEFKIKDPNVLSVDHHILVAKVKTEKFVYLTDASSIIMAQSEECDVIMTQDTFIETQYAFPIVQHSAYTTIFSNV